MPGMACIEAFVYPTEDRDKVLKALQTITSMTPQETNAQIDFGAKMLILKACTSDDKEIEAITTRLGVDVSQQQEQTIMLNKQRAFLGEIVPGKGIKITLRKQKGF